MNRNEFLKLCTSLIGGLAIPGAGGESASAAKPGERRSVTLDDSYLARGLTAMARAEGWFDAHWGAGVLAGYYLCNKNSLDEGTIHAIQEQMDAVIRLRGSQFEPLPEEEADEALIGKVTGALPQAMQGGLRAHGHAVIFASLSTRALRDAPQMAQPALIRSLCGLSRKIARIRPQQPPDGTDYADTQAMIEATFDSLTRFKDLLGHPSVKRPNFTHMITHTEALMNLEQMGYGDLARAGYAGHRAHISAPVPEVDATIDAEADRTRLKDVMSRSYWKDPKNVARWNRKWDKTDNRNGYWIAFGHLFKVLYSYHRLLGRIDNQEKVRLCSAILLERYVNPDVQGG